jgi:hypothetical protein
MQVDEGQVGVAAAQQVAVVALEGGAGEHQADSLAARLGDLVAQHRKPAGAVVVVERRAGAHLGHIGGRMKSIALHIGGAKAMRQPLPDFALAATADAHDDVAAGRAGGRCCLVIFQFVLAAMITLTGRNDNTSGRLVKDFLWCGASKPLGREN